MGGTTSPTTGGGIQRMIHQVWLGSNPRPVEWMNTVREFAAAHGYEYKLWDEAAAEKLDWDSVPGLRRVYAGFSNELAGKADVIRLMALYEQGGFYIDADSVIMKPAKFAAFLKKNRHPVFFAWEDLKKNGKTIKNAGPELAGEEHRLIANGTIGAAAGHPFLRSLLGGLADNAERERGEQAWRKAGPLYITRVYHTQKEAGTKGVEDVHMYPMKLFYPVYWHGIKDPEMHKKVKIPGESMLFQYGYSTNGFADIFRRLRGGGRRATRALRVRAAHSNSPRRTRRIRR
jgi:mannosyltransferase OCH1-like enzyme